MTKAVTKHILQGLIVIILGLSVMAGQVLRIGDKFIVVSFREIIVIRYQEILKIVVGSIL